MGTPNDIPLRGRRKWENLVNRSREHRQNCTQSATQTQEWVLVSRSFEASNLPIVLQQNTEHIWFWIHPWRLFDNIKNIHCPVNVIILKSLSFTLSRCSCCVHYFCSVLSRELPSSCQPWAKLTPDCGCCFYSVLFCECVKCIWLKDVWNCVVMHIFQPMSSSQATPLCM